MKKSGILHPQIANLLASTGHTDELVITDAGLPIPEQVNTRIDLALKEGIPNFLDVLDTVLDEMVIEKIVLANEIREASPLMHKEILKRFQNIPFEYVSHIQFKERTKNSRGIIRTGEFTSYANVILISGVSY